jgi:hypothetical protein
MKKKFIGFYNPTNKEIEKAWSKGFFAFDANTLLNLYRYTDNTRKDFLGALQTIKDRLFLPYQAAYEYHNNRLDVIEGMEKSHDDLFRMFSENFDNKLKSQINQYKKHPSISVDKIEKLHTDFLNNLKKELETQKTKHPNFKTTDNVSDELNGLFEDSSVGEPFSKTDLKKIYEEGEVRYAEKIPPGYEDLSDKQKKSKQHIYGDLIIWKELLNFAKTKKLPLIFITDDRKEDWWVKQNGKTIRPREELIKEFHDITGIRILIYNADSFLSFAKERKLLPKLKEKTIEEVKSIRNSDVKNLYTQMGQSAINSTFNLQKYFDALGIKSAPKYSMADMANTQFIQSVNNLSSILDAQNLASVVGNPATNNIFKAYQSMNNLSESQRIAFGF